MANSFSEVPFAYKYPAEFVRFVLERSFIMLPGVGIQTEKSLWAQGIRDWDHLLRAEHVHKISTSRLKSLKSSAAMIRNLQQREMLRGIAAFLPSAERWRLLRKWDERFAAMDIEVVGDGRRMRPVMVSVLRGARPCRTLIRGDDLSWRALREALAGADFLVTFNGTSFDLPILIDNGFSLDGLVQIDLRRYALRAGLPGGLKRVESSIGIRRPRELEFSTSEQVSYLWRLWEERGSKNALDLLTMYNRLDVSSLVRIGEEIYSRLSRTALKGCAVPGQLYNH